MEYDGMSIGTRAFEARRNKNLKQSDVSKIIGIAQSSYSRFELGQYDMPISKIIKLCEILDISVAQLIGEDIITDPSDTERQLVDNILRYIKSIRGKT